MPLVGRTPEREAIFDFTFPYMTLHGAIVVRKGTKDIRDLSDLRGRQVAVMKGDNAEEFLRREDLGFQIHTTPTFQAALEELSRGLHDAVVVQRLVALRLIQELGFANLQIVDEPVEGFRQDFCFAVREGDRETLALLNEGLALVMADGTYRRLHAKWFAALQVPTDRPIIIGGDQNYPPFEYLDENGRPAGFAVELTRAIAREMNMDIRIRLMPWASVGDSLAKGEIDAVEGMFYSTERDREFDFSAPYLVSHYVFVSRRNIAKIPETISDLKDLSVVVRNKDVILAFLAEHGLESRITVAENHEAAMRKVWNGRCDCALVPQVSAMYLIEKNRWDNLILGGRSFFSGEYAYAVPKGQPALLAEFAEGLKVLEESGEYRRMYEKWLGIYKEDKLSLIEALRKSAWVLGPLLFVFFAIFLWTWSLRKQVARKTRELRESADRFKNVFEAANVGKSMTLPGGEVRVNQAFADFLGYTRKELNEKRWQDITPAEDIEATEQIIAPLLKGGKDSARFEKRYIHKNGALLWADASVAMHRDESATPLYFVTTIVDITERKRAEEKLRESEEFLRAMIACSPVALYSIDPDGNVMAWNASSERVLGWTAEEVVGTPLPIVPEDKQDEFKNLRSFILAGKAFSNLELVRMKKDGSLFDCSISEAPILDDSGEVVGIMSALEDITERKRSEKEREKLQSQLLHAQKLESVARLAGGVAHDFNNMLSVIIGYSQMALDKTPIDDPLFEDLNEILEAAVRSADITRQLLAFCPQADHSSQNTRSKCHGGKHAENDP